MARTFTVQHTEIVDGKNIAICSGHNYSDWSRLSFPAVVWRHGNKIKELDVHLFSPSEGAIDLGKFKAVVGDTIIVYPEGILGVAPKYKKASSN
jgi:hypothetical protein